MTDPANPPAAVDTSREAVERVLADLAYVAFEPEWSDPADVADATAALIRAQAAEIARLKRTIGFFASCIKSGESWSPTCEAEMRAALPPPPTSDGEAGRRS